MIRSAELGERLQQNREILFAREPPGIGEQARVCRQSQALPQLMGAALGAEHFGVHAQWLVNSVMNTHLIEQLAHEPAGSQHDVESLIQPAQITADRLLAPRAQPAAHDLGEIGVIERDDRNATIPRYRGGTPGRMERVSRFDQIRLELLEKSDPAARIQRQAIVERAGYRKSRKRGNAAALHARPRPGHDDRVLPGSVRAEPGMLRGNIAFYAAAGRRIKKCRVHQMHD